MEDVVGQLRAVTFQTGAFLVAWSWVLVYYAISHAAVGESPLQDQIGFGGQGQPQNLLVLALEYVIVCGATAALLERMRANGSSEALAAAVAFFPSPVFSGKLLQFLGQFSSDGLQLGLMNVAATAVVAAAVHAAPRSGQYKSIGDVLRSTVGFGLGVAWNSLVSRAEPGQGRLIARSIYLGVVVLLAARLAAPPARFDSLRSRIAALLSFAMRVVCAFALVDWLQGPHSTLGFHSTAAVRPTPLYEAASLVGLVLLAAQMSVLLAEADLDGAQADAKAKAVKTGFAGWLLRILVLVPCVWCCCPWIPLLWLLSGGSEGVTTRWTSLAADVCSLAASVVGTGLITTAIDTAAAKLRICDAEACDVVPFLALEVAASAVFTAALVAFLGWVNEAKPRADASNDAGDGSGGYVLLAPTEPMFVQGTYVA
mmetsp:Transcript_344/g.1186  ORF Transcript_344/g.1186 Transcript_344/m.1186 type:complete len:427 (+) Transcript_344:63-1343(+)